MPLSKRARIEVYLPEKQNAQYRRLHKVFEDEFLDTFGGCTVVEGIQGLYSGADGRTENDKICLIYTYTPFDFDENVNALADYTDELREAALEASAEESILVVVHEIYQSL